VSQTENSRRAGEGILEVVAGRRGSAESVFEPTEPERLRRNPVPDSYVLSSLSKKMRKKETPEQRVISKRCSDGTAPLVCDRG
jgi:hypothetical protein